MALGEHGVHADDVMCVEHAVMYVVHDVRRCGGMAPKATPMRQQLGMHGVHAVTWHVGMRGGGGPSDLMV